MTITDTEPVALHSGLAELADRYDGYILDLWGVVHNGLAPYPGAVDCMRRLRTAGKRIVLLSNAPRSSAAVRTFLAGIGVAEDCYDDIVTSGDATREALESRSDPWHARLGWSYYYLGKTADAAILSGLGYIAATSLSGAEFILNLGLADPENESVETYRPLLEEALVNHLPLICGNPDLTVMRGDSMQDCAGALAKAYEDIGGDVFWHGKPHARVYEICFGRMDGVSPERVLAIGDSFRTDIAGANAAGIDSLFAMGGIHAEEFGLGPDGAPDPSLVEPAVAAGGHRPTGVISGLRW